MDYTRYSTKLITKRLKSVVVGKGYVEEVWGGGGGVRGRGRTCLQEVQVITSSFPINPPVLPTLDLTKSS